MVVRTLVASLFALAGCHRVFGLERPPDDASEVPDAGQTCLGTGLVEMCAYITDDTVELRDRFDTGTDPRCLDNLIKAGAGDVCLIGANHIVVPFPLRVVGPRPLLLVARETIDVTAEIDASSKRGGVTGGGARTTCTAPMGTGAIGVASGGAGGTHGYAGGAGGTVGAAVGPAPSAVTPLVALTGGCGGGEGGFPNGQSGRAPAGAGGGALYLIAGTSIRVTGAGINVSGAGGDGGATRRGGGGGGAGGMVGFDAPSIVLDANVLSKGGGGGGGGGDTSAGQSGRDADLATPLGAVDGGSGGGGGGRGGDGSNGTIGGVPGGPATSGGGGGGGGAGYVLISGQRTGSGTVNPVPTKI